MAKLYQCKRLGLNWVSIAVMLVTAGCSLAPTYERPSLPQMPEAFKEGAQQAAGAVHNPTALAEKQAGPVVKDAPDGKWWTIFGDPALDQLEQQAQDANQDLKAAMARVKQSRAVKEGARSGLFPAIDIGFGPTRQKQSAVSQFQPDGTNIPVQTLWRAQANVSYEADLFGRVASINDASEADTEQSEALFRAARLALQADVAQTYFALRDLDSQAAVLDSAIDLREHALNLAQRRFSEGETTELDLTRAKAELASSRSDAMTVKRLRAASEHGLAVLLGQAPAAFSLAERATGPVNVHVPPALPSSLLLRRPDIEAAERAIAAANARIGVAKAAFFPMLELTGTGGFESATLADLFKWSSRVFLLGPVAGAALTTPLFDWGRRQGNLDRVRAVYEEDVARYRQQVLTAFREVEDSLADLRILEDQLGTQADAVEASERAAQLSQVQFREGAVDYINVIDTERTLLQARRAMVQIEGRKASQTVELIRALGGGWGEGVVADNTGSSIAQR